MKLKTDRNCHALYNLEYHVVLVTKYRKSCINDAVFKSIKTQAERIIQMKGGTIEAINYEGDHVHMLLSMPPQACMSVTINNIKTTTARIVRRDHGDYLKQYYWKPVFWSRSYLILSSGGAPIEVIKQYIEEQGTEEHANKKKYKHQGRNTPLSPPKP